MTKGWDAGRYHDHRTGDEIRFLEGLGTHAPQRKWDNQRGRLLAGYRRSMALRWVWGKIDPWKILDYLEEKTKCL